MWKTAKYLVAMVLVIALFASTSGIALADDGQQGNGGQNSFWDVLARAFNTTAENAKNLFMQAGGKKPPAAGDNTTPNQPPTGENRGAVTQEQLDKMVADGRLTQEQADEYAAWLEARPEGQYGDPNQMQKLLEDGTITQEQYDTWNTWNETKPDIELPRPDRQGNGDNRPNGQGNDNPGQAPTGEKREEMTVEKLDQLVSDGELTQEQADEYETWLTSRPDGPFVDKERMQNLLDNGTITQEQYDAWKAWHGTKPDVELPKPQGQGNGDNKPNGQGNGYNRPNGQQGNRPPPVSDNTTPNQPPLGDNHRPPPPPGGPGGNRR